MPAYHRSDLPGDLFADLDRAIDALQDGHTGIALGVLDDLLRGPYPLEPLQLPERRTLARRVCGCGRSLGYALWAEDKAHPDEPYTETHTICADCLANRERAIEARYATEHSVCCESQLAHEQETQTKGTQHEEARSIAR